MSEQAAKSRDQLRQALLGNAPKGKSKVIKMFGQEIELRQPALRDMMKAQDTPDPAKRAAELIIAYCYVPGTNEKVFEETDRDVILGWPFGDDMNAFNEAVSELVGVDIGSAEEDIKDPTQEPS